MEIYSSVVSCESIRIAFTVAVLNDLEVHSLFLILVMYI